MARGSGKNTQGHLSTNDNPATQLTTTTAASSVVGAPRSLALSSASSAVTSRRAQNSASPALQGPRNLQRISKACVQCQKKKTKCDGGRPKCKLCSRANSECTYSQSKRETERSHFQSLEHKVNAYESLLQDIISQATPDNRRSIDEAIQKHLKIPPELLSNLLASRSLSDPPLQTPKPGLSLARMHLASSLADEKPDSLQLLQKPPVQVTSIHVWTTIVDNDVASHLLSLYFTWENPVWHLIDQEMFIHDLERGSRRFCSPLLVHTLLFFGCSFSYNLNRITDRLEEKVLGEKLYAAIQRLWVEEKENADLPTAQSTILMGLLCCTFGIDRLGTKYIMHGAELSSRVGLEKDHSPYFSSGIDDNPIAVEGCQKFVSWAIYDLQALASQVYRKTPVWKGPPAKRFSQEEAAVLDEDGKWTPYPFQNPVSEPFYYTTAWIRSELVEIVFDIATWSLKFPSAALDDSDWDYGYELHQKLVTWRTKLPWSVLPRHNTTPHVLCLHFYYYATLVSLCEVFILNSKEKPRNPRISDRFDPLTIKSQALDTIGSLVLLYKHTHGWRSIPIVMLHYFCVAGIHSISRLHPHEPKWSLVLESSVVGLWHMSLGWGRLCKAFLRTIDLVLKAQKPDPSLVPPRVAAILLQLDDTLWTGTDMSSLAADYVVHHVPAAMGQSSGATGTFEAHTLQSLLVAMEDLSVESAEPTGPAGPAA